MVALAQVCAVFAVFGLLVTVVHFVTTLSMQTKQTFDEPLARKARQTSYVLLLMSLSLIILAIVFQILH